MSPQNPGQFRLMIRVVSSLRQITGFRVMGMSGSWTKT
ncbi:hypothetical protein ApDm4_1470 [Acetobacter pomorum]|nr:hypothetical protein ApDm4_1470 [Acetobacter pomorum]